MGFSVEASLDRYVASRRKDKQPDGWWHPSSFSLCARRAVYDFRGTPQSNPPEDRVLRVFEVGHEFHRLVQGAIAADEQVMDYYPEVEASHPELGIGGHSDGLLRLAPTGVWEAHEYKSINSMAFRYRNLPKDEHVTQVLAYIRSARDYGGTIKDADGQPIGKVPPLGDSLQRGRIVYISKDDLKIEEYIVHYTPAKARELEELLGGLRTYEQPGDDALPPRLPDEVKQKGKQKGEVARAWQCGYCPFRDLCWD